MGTCKLQPCNSVNCVMGTATLCFVGFTGCAYLGMMHTCRMLTGPYCNAHGHCYAFYTPNQCGRSSTIAHYPWLVDPTSKPAAVGCCSGLSLLLWADTKGTTHVSTSMMHSDLLWRWQTVAA